MKRAIMRLLASVVMLAMSLELAHARSFSIDLRQHDSGNTTRRHLLSASGIQQNDGVLRSFNLDAGAVNVGEVAVGDELTFTLFDDVSITLTLGEQMPSPLGGEVFLAEASGYEGVKTAVVLRTADGLTIDVQDFLNDKWYKVMSTPSGVKVSEIQPSHEHKCGNDSLEPPDFSHSDGEFQKAASGKVSATHRLLASGAEDKACIDILVAYDKGASSWAAESGGGVTNFAIMAVSRMNVCIANTGLYGLFRFRLVGIVQVEEQTDSLDAALDSATEGSPGWEAIRAARDEVGADIVSVLIDTGSEDGTVGLGWVLTKANEDLFSGHAYNACAIRSVAISTTMAHECGHNMGCGHADVQETQPGPGMYEYSSGYYFVANDSHFATIMAYAHENPDSEWTFEVPYFSSPEYCYKEAAVGDEVHDNTRTIRETYEAVAKFREVKVLEVGSKWIIENGVLHGVNYDGDTDLVIPDGVSSIATNAFAECDWITSVTIPGSVTNMCLGAFRDCASITNVVMLPGVTHVGDYAFKDCIALESVTIPDSVTSIGSSAFRECFGLTSVTIPDSVTSIGDDAFWYCTNLESVTIGNSVTSIGNLAFWGCYSLTSVTIPDSVTNIGDEALSHCYNLKTVYIPASIYVDEISVFGGCPQDLEIIYTGDYVVILLNANGGVVDESELRGLLGRSIGTLPVPVREGYLFAGWWTALEGGVMVTDDSKFEEGLLELYAHWQESPFRATYGDSIWCVDADGSWRSGKMSDTGYEQCSSAELDVVGPVEVTFRWKASSESSYDKLHFYVDGIEAVSAISGDMEEWVDVSYKIYSVGLSVLRFEYTKDGSVSYGDDCGWVKDLSCKPLLYWTNMDGDTTVWTGDTINESNLDFMIPATKDLPKGAKIKINKIRLASLNDTFTIWDKESCKSDPSFVRLNGVNSDLCLGFDGTISSNGTTSYNALTYTFSNPCEVIVGRKYAAATGNNIGAVGNGIAFLHSNGKLLYGDSADRASVRYVKTDDMDSLMSTRSAPSGFYPVYEVEAEIVSLEPDSGLDALALEYTASFSYHRIEAIANGWFGGATGFSGGTPQNTDLRIGPSDDYEYVLQTTASLWPYRYVAARTSEFSIVLYADISAMPSGNKAVMVALGGESSSQAAILYREGDAVRFAGVKSTGEIIGSAASVEVKGGYHLYCAVCDPQTGELSLSLDGSAVATGSTEGAVSLGNGFQIGSVYGGRPSGFSAGANMAIVKLLGYEAGLTAKDVQVLASEYPAIETRECELAAIVKTNTTVTIADGQTVTLGVDVANLGSLVVRKGGEGKVVVTDAQNFVGCVVGYGITVMDGGSLAFVTEEGSEIGESRVTNEGTTYTLAAMTGPAVAIDEEKMFEPVSNDDGVRTIMAKQGKTLSQSDADKVTISVAMEDGATVADTTAGYRMVYEESSNTIVITLKVPEVDVEVEEEKKASDDATGMLVDAEKVTLSANPPAESGEKVEALPVKAVRGLYYQAAWGDDLGNLIYGEKVQATEAELYLGVIKQKGDKGFYKVTVSEK